MTRAITSLPLPLPCLFFSCFWGRLKLQLLEDISDVSDHRHVWLLHAKAKLPAFVIALQDFGRDSR